MRADLPTIDQESAPWWEGCARGELLIRRCGACGAAHLYPRVHCPTCWSEDVVWETASGRGRLHTWSVVHRNDLPPFRDRVPYVAAIVELDEGQRIATNLVDADADALRIDLPVEVVFVTDEEGGLTVPCFRPL
jgi:uncharacterized protein